MYQRLAPSLPHVVALSTRTYNQDLELVCDWDSIAKVERGKILKADEILLYHDPSILIHTKYLSNPIQIGYQMNLMPTQTCIHAWFT